MERAVRQTSELLARHDQSAKGGRRRSGAGDYVVPAELICPLATFSKRDGLRRPPGSFMRVRPHARKVTDFAAWKRNAMTVTTDDLSAIFNRLVHTEPTPGAFVQIDTACVMGGSIAGLLAARVLADHARTVVVVERDEVNTQGRSRAGVPQDRQLHTLLPAGHSYLDRWLPGFSREAQDRGAVLTRPDQLAVYRGSDPQVKTRGLGMVTATRPVLESLVRSRVLAQPNVRAISAAATGLEISDHAVRAVRYVEGGREQTLDVDFAVDAMGRSSRLADWIERAGYQRPHLKRLRAEINYVTAVFERAEDANDIPITAAHSRPADPLKPEAQNAFAFAVEDQQWMVLLMRYGTHRPPREIDALRAACAALPAVFGRAVAGRVTRGIETYRQADSRRRDFTGLLNYPSRLISVGDAAASFNPVYGQGMSSAALQASALSQYLASGPQLDRPATGFFELQSVVVDAAWAMSAGVDAARLDALNRVDVADDVKRQRWALDQVMHAAHVDSTVAEAFGGVTAMLAHPSSLFQPELLERAVAVNQQRQR
jgi:2-polyprenyl-6-methoxyphenol hydroxylase-like FAD-dependent oxidoreductase